jgi:hypothetical protein
MDMKWNRLYCECVYVQYIEYSTVVLYAVYRVQKPHSPFWKIFRENAIKYLFSI